jgi:hypothetical protein
MKSGREHQNRCNVTRLIFHVQREQCCLQAALMHGVLSNCAHRHWLLAPLAVRAFTARSLPTKFASFQGVAPTAAAPPLVYHPRYSCIWPEEHRFPMTKFKDTAKHVTEYLKIASLSDLFRPPDEPDEALMLLAHSPEYYHAFMGGTLPPDATRRIGACLRLKYPITHARSMPVTHKVALCSAAHCLNCACRLADTAPSRAD